MNDFKNETSTQKPLDPYKRVKYTMGLVMGEDEFEQEQLYLIEKNRLHNRALHGYGTICGLHISVRDTGSGPEVVVFPGIALNPLGQEIRVPSTRCAQLNDWLMGNRDKIVKQFPGTSSDISAYVVLCYQECETDKVPIPGLPCRKQEDIMAASRIADDFSLSLRFEMDPKNEKSVPSQLEEEAVVRFGDLLGRIEITAEPGTFLSMNEMEDMVRDLITENGSPSVPVGYGSPISDGSLRLHPSEASDILKAAFRVWVTEVRPRILGRDNNCNLCYDEGSCSCVRLARLEIPVRIVDGGMKVNGIAKDVKIFNDDRPILLHTRLLQEWLLCGRLGRTASMETSRTFVTLFSINPTTIRAWVHHPHLLDIPFDAVSIDVADGQTGSPPQPHPYLVSVSRTMPEINVYDLELSVPIPNNNRVTVYLDSNLIIEMTTPLKTLHDVLEKIDYGYIDREGDILMAYLAVNIPALDDLSDVDAYDPDEDSVLTYKNGSWKAIKADNLVESEMAGGDLKGYYPDPEVVGLRKVPISEPEGGILEENAVLKHNNGKWVPAKLDHGSLNGLGNDDHPQYHNDTRGNALYSRINHTHDHGALNGLGNSNDHKDYLLADGTRPLKGNLDANNINKIINLNKATSAGDAVRYNEAITIDTKAGNDLKGLYPRPAVQGLQQRAVADISPRNGQVLAWDKDNKQWEPKYFVEAKSEPHQGVPYAIVAAGFFNINGTEVKYNGRYNDLDVSLLDQKKGLYLLKFAGYVHPVTNTRTYILKGTVQGNPDKYLSVSIQFVDFLAEGIRIKIMGTNNEPVKTVGFMIEISEFGTDTLI